MKKIIILMLTLIVLGFGIMEADAWIIIQKGIYPTRISGTVTQPQINSQFDTLFNELNTRLLQYQRQPKLAKGFANASAYSSHVATQRGYQGYDLYAVTIGAMVGGQAPSRRLSYYKKIGDEIENKGDIYAGAAIAPAVQVGLNGAIFGLEDFYFAVKFGKFAYTYDDYSANVLSTGISANYQLMGQTKAPLSIFLWRGFSIGTGFFIQTNDLKMQLKILKNSKVVGLSQVVIDPKFTFKVNTSSYVIPTEVTTSIRLLWILNLTAGAGVDFAFGQSSIKVNGIAPVYLYGESTASPGFVYAYGKQDGKSSKHVMPKAIAGVGLSFGPVTIDVPVTYYFVNGFNAGVSVGFVW